ncbi:MAG: T9SS type A sorting domain-containing protein [Saprospiraceae bacterium]|nr:T9SS type A sorting domain-containing protein [Saprospiraceae bacterium]
MRVIILASILPFLWSVGIFSQGLPWIPIPVIDGEGRVLRYGATGGADNIQVNTIDLDGDAVEDLVLFDRAGDVLLPFRYDPVLQEYAFSPQYRVKFPRLKDWTLFRDFNGDGIADLFASSFNTEGIPGIELYRGSRGQAGLEFEKFDMGKPFKVLFFSLGNNTTQIPIDFTDIPVIEDLDGDGDLDILLFEPGNNRVSLFKNIVKERAFSNDTMAFVLADRCFGGFVESGFTAEITLSGSPDSCASFRNAMPVLRHSGSTLLSQDLDGNGLPDLLVGDLTNNGLIALFNAGSLERPYMNKQQTNWPGNSDSLDLATFLAAFSADVDHDGLTDILVAPNQRSISENIDNLWYYRNVGTAAAPKFQRNTRSFLVGEMMDLGSATDPCFVDFNQDGKMDLIVGTEGFFIRGTNLRDARLVLFENVGTETTPAFALADSNYLEFNDYALSADAHHSFTPAFGDLDNDGDFDMLVGENQGQFFFCENTAGAGKPFQFNKPEYPYQELSAKSYSSPYLIDLNGDGRLDIVSGSRLNTNDPSGKACGSFYYFQNQGTPEEAAFDPDYFKEPNTNCLGNIIVNGISSKVYSSPEFYQYQGALNLFTGNIFGEVKRIGGITQDPDGTYEMLNPHYGLMKEGERITLSLADIDSDGVLEMVTGNARGGISFYKTDLLGPTASENPQRCTRFILTPNPSGGALVVHLAKEVEYTIQIFDASGKCIATTYTLSGFAEIPEAQRLSPGVYFVTVSDGHHRWVEKWIKR